MVLNDKILTPSVKEKSESKSSFNKVELICGKCSHLMPQSLTGTGYVIFECKNCNYHVESPNLSRLDL